MLLDAADARGEMIELGLHGDRPLGEHVDRLLDVSQARLQGDRPVFRVLRMSVPRMRWSALGGLWIVGEQSRAAIVNEAIARSHYQQRLRLSPAGLDR